MKVGWNDIGNLTASDPSSINKAIIVPAKEALRQTRLALTKNLTLKDNQYAAVVTFGAGTHSMTSGVEYTFTNPLKTAPIGFTVLTATNTVGVDIQLASPPKLNRSRTDGLLGLTAYQDLLGGTGDIGEYSSISITNNPGVTLTTATAISIGSLNLSPGAWLVGGESNFSCTAAVTGSRVIGSLSLTTNTLGSPNQRAQVPSVPIIGVADVQITLPMLQLTVAASTTVFSVSQVTFSAGNIQGSGQIFATRMTRFNSSQMILTGILWGG